MRRKSNTIYSVPRKVREGASAHSGSSKGPSRAPKPTVVSSRTLLPLAPNQSLRQAPLPQFTKETRNGPQSGHLVAELCVRLLATDGTYWPIPHGSTILICCSSCANDDRSSGLVHLQHLLPPSKSKPFTSVLDVVATTCEPNRGV